MTTNLFRRLRARWTSNRPGMPICRTRPQLERLEDRLTPAAPTLSIFNPNIVIPGGQTFQVPITAHDADGDTLTYHNPISSSPQVSAEYDTLNTRFLVLNVTFKDANGQTMTGDLVFKLFEQTGEAPVAVGRIVQLAQMGFYNGVTFHRVIQDFMAQGGDPTGTGGGGSMLPDFADEFSQDLRFNGFGQLAMANSGPNTNNSQFFITDVDLSVGSPDLSKRPPGHLNDHHTIFGQLVEGFSLFASLISTPKFSLPPGNPNPPSDPIDNPIINTATVITNSQDQVLRVSVPSSFHGVATVTVEVDDGNGGTATQSFQVSVANEAPTLGTIPTLGTTVNQQLRYMLPRSDREHDWLIFANGSPDVPGTVVNLNPVTGLLTVQPPSGFVGTIHLVVGVADSFPRLNPFDVETLTINVTANQAPTITDPSGPVAAVNGGDTRIVLAADDGDTDAVQQLTFEITTLPTGGKLRDAAGHLLTVHSKITATDLGEAIVYYTANQLTTTDFFKVKVRDNGGTAGGGADTSAPDATVNLTVSAPGGIDNSTYTLVNTPAGKQLVVNGTTGDDSVEVRRTFDGKVMVTLNNDTPRVLGTAFLKGGVNVLGGEGNDTLTATANFNLKVTLDGGAGDDSLTGGAAADRLFGGPGNDLLAGRGGNDNLSGGDDNDMLLGAAGNDVLKGDADNDSLDGGAGIDQLQGGDGNDLLFSGPGADKVTGAAGADIFGPKAGADKRDFKAADLDRNASAFDDADLLGLAVFEMPNAPNIFNAASGFLETTSSINYATLGFTNPPTYGPHRPPTAGTTPVPTGFYTTTKQDESLVENLERGHVWITYRADLLSDDDVQALKDLVGLLGPQSGVVVTPRDFGQDAIELMTWGRILPLNSLDLDQIRQFIFTNRGAGRPAEGYKTP